MCAASTGQQTCPEPSNQPCSKVLARELGNPFNLNTPFLGGRGRIGLYRSQLGVDALVAVFFFIIEHAHVHCYLITLY